MRRGLEASDTVDHFTDESITAIRRFFVSYTVMFAVVRVEFVCILV
jgi:hypothetical protein